MAEREYHRLTRARRRSTGFAVAGVELSSLWLGRDHVLCIESNGYTEKYKRFYFQDIQAIMLRRTMRQLWLGIFMFLPAVLFTLIAIGVADEIGSTFLGFFAAAFWVGFIYNLAAGPTTTGYLRTAVQTEELPSLRRLRQARKVIARIQPFIAAKQGLLTAEEAVAQWEQLRAPPPVPGVPPVISP